jgi:hypothetical protein
MHDTRISLPVTDSAYIKEIGLSKITKMEIRRNFRVEPCNYEKVRKKWRIEELFVHIAFCRVAG